MLSNFREDLSVVIGAAKKGNNHLSFPFVINSETGAADIEALNLTPRSEHALRRAKIMTVNKVVTNFGDLAFIRNLGNVSIREIKQKVCDYLYDMMTTKERKAFWREFITINNIKGLSTK